jgi:hypothetical protein
MEMGLPSSLGAQKADYFPHHIIQIDPLSLRFPVLNKREFDR